MSRSACDAGFFIFLMKTHSDVQHHCGFFVFDLAFFKKNGDICLKCYDSHFRRFAREMVYEQAYTSFCG